MADSFNKKEREKKKRKRAKEKKERKEQRKSEDNKVEFMYVDEDGNLTPIPPDPNKKKEEINLEDIMISVPKSEKSDEPDFLRKGIVKFFNSEKGYGFIEDGDTRESFFVHSNNLVDQIRDNDKVTFEVGKGPKGPIAIDVKLA